VPYHASLLLLWNAYLNIQRITSSYGHITFLNTLWKCEPHGTLNLSKKKKKAKWLGLQDVSEVQLQLISSLIINKPIYPQEVAFTWL
jgi:hypothetical protein